MTDLDQINRILGGGAPHSVRYDDAGVDRL